MFKKGIFVLTLIGILGVGFYFPKNSFAAFGDYTGVSFSTSGSGNDYPTGITAYNNFFWVIDGVDAEVYKYNPDGTYASFSFDTAGSGNNDPLGITAYNDFFWITDYADLEVYKYNPDGTYTGTSFDTAGSGSDLPSGIATYNDFLWITDWNDAEVYRYNPDGTYTGVHFDTSSNSNNGPEGIVSYNGYFWIADDINREVYMYYPSGTKTNFSFDTNASGNATPIGITYYNNFFWITDATDALVYKYDAIDAVIPTISGLYPSDGQVDVLPSTNLNITFSEIMKVGTGNITIKKSSDDSVVEAIDVESGQVILGGQTTFQINPSSDLEPGISYYVQIDATAFDDLFGNSFVGIADTTTWNFTTDGTPPTVSTLTPTDGAEGVSANSNLLITFNENVVAGVGNILIKKSSDNSIVQTIDVTDGGLVEVSGTDVTINPSSNLGLATAYYVQIDAGAFEDNSGNSFAGIADTTTWNFTIGSSVHDGIERVSISDLGVEGDSDSNYSSISSAGRYVAFQSYATNLVASDTNNEQDIFVYDRDTDTIERISVSSAEAEGNGSSGYPIISANGNYVVFTSYATNLVAGDTNGFQDVFLRDIALGATSRISVDSNEVEGDSDSYSPYISSDGNFITFVSDAANLVAGDTNGSADIFMRDIALGTTTRISVSSDEVEGDNGSDGDIQSMPSDNNLVVFSSTSTNLIAGDTNGSRDVFLRDIELGTTMRISVDSSEVEGDSTSTDPIISADGNFVVFRSEASNLVSGDTNGSEDIFIRDITLGTTTRISVDNEGSEGDTQSYYPTISSDGRYIAYSSQATNLVDNDTNALIDVFLYDRDTETVVRVSVDDDGNQISNSNQVQSRPSISEDNQYISFDFSNGGVEGLVSDDTNNSYDVFVVYFNRVVEEAEPEVQARSSSGSTRRVLKPQNISVVIPINSLAPCTSGALFSNLTGAPCGTSNFEIHNNPNPNKFIFTKNLWAPMVDVEVKELQKYLNTHGFPLATSGIGSLGNETNKFGNLTIQALKKFQSTHELKPDAVVGPMTRDVLNGD